MSVAKPPLGQAPPRLHGAELARVLLSPTSVAVVGASDDAGKTSGRPLTFLRQAGFAGRVYPVNPRRAQVQGETAWPDLASLPEVPEHVFVITPTETVLDTVRECARLGVRLVTVLASGFSEAGPEGLAREQALQDIARRSGLRVLGPSSLGVVNPRAGMPLTANAAFAEPDMPVGRVMVISHSGSMIGALVSRGRARGVGFASLVSVGNEADLSVGEIAAATLDDPQIEGYVLFLESLHHGRALRAFALAAAERGKPVVVYKLGRSSVAADMVQSHTGALAGEDDIADAYFKDSGMARVGILESLLEAQALAVRWPLLNAQSPLRRVGVVTTTGGGAAMLVDQLGIRGVVVEAASAQTLQRLHAQGVSVNPGRVLDLTLAGTRYEVMKAALDVMLTAPEFDAVVAVVGSSARFQPQLAVQPIIDSAAHSKPLAAMIVPDAPQAIAQLTAAQVPCFRTPECCADVIAALVSRRAPSVRAALAALGPPGVDASANAPENAKAKAQTQANALAPVTWSERQSHAWLAQLGVPSAAAVVVAADGPVPLPLPFAYPVVVKACSAQLAHKSEHGGVVLGVADAQALRLAMEQVKTNVARHAPLPADFEILVQPMVKGLAEVLLGFKRDPDAGAIVMLAVGGIWAEVVRERSIRLAPVDEAQAMEMITALRALSPLQGLRGQARGDLAALAQAISRFSQAAVLAVGDGVIEAEVNPLMVLPEGQGVCAVDALVLAGAGPEHG
jgi:acyl-CoA synthetase (NDP forming)